MTRGKTIKIFVDAHVFDGEYQGSRTFLLDLYQAMSKKPGLQLYMAAYNLENLKMHFSEDASIRFIQYRSRSGWIRLSWDIPAIIRKHGIHYAHFQYIVPLFRNCRFIVTTHDVLFNEYPEEFSYWFRKTKIFLYKRSANMAAVLTTDSAYSKNSIRKFLGIPDKQINIIFPGVSVYFFEDHNKHEAKDFISEQFGIGKFILYVSRFEPRKNHAMLLQSYLELELYKQGIHLVMLGHHSARVSVFDRMLAAMPEEARPYIFIDDKLDNATVLRFYRAAALFVYPSKAEGFGLPPLEAAATGTPVICSNTSSMAEFDFFGQNHIDPNDRELFKSRLMANLQNEPGRDWLHSIKETIRERYTAEKAADQLLQLILDDHNKTIFHD